MFKILTKEDSSINKYFLNLPIENNPRNYKEEKSILEGTHPLSKYFEIYPYVVLDNEKSPICRCALTYYDNDSVAYLGFFEAKQDINEHVSSYSQYSKAAVHEMFSAIKEKVAKDGKTKIIGPIDASIFINYRFKLNNFEELYTGEPTNKTYYPQMWESEGFSICEKYYSYRLRKLKSEDNDEKFERLLERYKSRGFEFVKISSETFSNSIKDIYKLLMDLYSNFPGYKKISEEQFIKLFSSLDSILNYDMTSLAYKDGELYAFCIAVPNYYGETHGSINFFKMKNILKYKKNPEEYIILYLGASSRTLGLGAAVSQEIKNELYKKQTTSISALIRENNAPNKYYEHMQTNKFEYALYDFIIRKDWENISYTKICNIFLSIYWVLYASSLILSHFDILYLPAISYVLIILYLCLEIMKQETCSNDKINSNSELNLLEGIVVSITTMIITASTLLMVDTILALIIMIVWRAAWIIIYKKLSLKIMQKKKEYNIRNHKTKKE